ncbi:TetR/AcrR family transcriptional regulator [Advenella sp. FME57]|uniref:TetR/AcrR family transcriptional regulator n=1 Tax=Advenella sp. FME57 TaxID=2742604 RepID=UPI0018682EB0|nr:TetR/AcrR family transcriptional regulator [Advenella sp. FME57]
MTDRITRKRQRTQAHIAQIAVALFEKHGYESVTMEQIATESDVARGTLYNHFAVKDAVLVYWIHTQLSDALGPLVNQVLTRSSFVERVAIILNASAAWWEKHQSFAAPYIRYRFHGLPGGQGAAPSDLIPVYAQLIKAAQKTDEIASLIPADRLARYLHYLYLSALMEWLADPEQSLSQQFAQAFDFFMNGADSGKK